MKIVQNHLHIVVKYVFNNQYNLGDKNARSVNDISFKVLKMLHTLKIGERYFECEVCKYFNILINIEINE